MTGNRRFRFLRMLNRHHRRLAAITMAALLVLSGCGKEFDAVVYLKAVLDNTYRGESRGYVEEVDITVEEAEAEYENGLKTEADFFLKYYGLNNVSEDIYEDIIEMYKKLYQHSSYEAGKCFERDGGYIVIVSVRPITVFTDSMEEIRTAVEKFVDAGNPDSYVGERELHDRLAELVIGVIEKNGENPRYGKKKAVSVKVKQNEEGLYYPDAEAMSQIDQLIIAY